MQKLTATPYVRRYLGGQTLSILGDTSLWLAMAIWVRQLTGSNADSGLTFFFMAAPSIVGPAWGTLIDRVPRRPVLITINVAGAALTLALLAVHNRHQVWIIWAVMLGYGVVNSMLGAAQNGFLRTLLPDEALGDAQAWLSTVREGLRLISPLIGAGLFAVAGGHVVAIIDAATFALAAATVISIRVTEIVAPRVEQRLRTEVAAGYAHIRATIRLRQVVITLIATCAVIGFCETAGIAVITTGLHLPATWLGPLQFSMGIGALIGGPTVSRAMRRWSEGPVSAAGTIACGAAALLLMAPSIPVVFFADVLFGFGLPWVIAPANTLIQRLTPGHLQGRVSATVDLLTGPPQAISIAVGAGLVSIVGYRSLLAVVGVVMLAAGVWLVTRPEQHVRDTSGAPDTSAGPSDAQLSPSDLEVAQPDAGLGAHAAVNAAVIAAGEGAELLSGVGIQAVGTLAGARI